MKVEEMFAVLPPRLALQIQSRVYLPWVQPQRRHAMQRLRVGQLPVEVLREDESGFGMSGTKRRKLASLIPYWQETGVERIGIIGGTHSNHVIAALQAAREGGFEVHAFLLDSHHDAREGNAFLARLLLADANVTWISREDWPQVEQIAESILHDPPGYGFLLPEGGACGPALAGAVTLPLSFANRVGGCDYQEVWMDSGTGFIATATLLMAGRLGWDTQFRIVMVAGTEASFRQMIRVQQLWWEAEFEEAAPEPAPYQLVPPATARAFGAVNAAVRQEVERMAREEGILVDPIYTAKLFLTLRGALPHIQGPCLVIHSGGGTGLLGFAKKW